MKYEFSDSEINLIQYELSALSEFSHIGTSADEMERDKIINNILDKIKLITNCDYCDNKAIYRSKIKIDKKMIKFKLCLEHMNECGIDS